MGNPTVSLKKKRYNAFIMQIMHFALFGSVCLPACGDYILKTSPVEQVRSALDPFNCAYQ